MDEKLSISTLTCPNITLGYSEDRELRCKGNTTKQVDFAIQKLFEGYEIAIQDHWSNGKLASANKNLKDRIKRRLEVELRISKNQIKERREKTIDFLKLNK